MVQHVIAVRPTPNAMELTLHVMKVIQSLERLVLSHVQQMVLQPVQHVIRQLLTSTEQNVLHVLLMQTVVVGKPVKMVLVK